MPMTSRSIRPSRRPVWSFTLLLGAVALVGVLAYQAYAAARSHRRTAEAALLDYAAFAGWEYKDFAELTLDVAVRETFGPTLGYGASLHAASPLPHPAALLANQRQLCECTPMPRLRYAFRMRPDGGDWLVAGTLPPPEVQAWVRDTVAAHVAATDTTSRRFTTIFGGPGDEARSIVFTVRQHARGDRYVFGFEAPADLYLAILREAKCDAPLLPPSLTGGAPNDSLVAIRVGSPLGGDAVVLGDGPPVGFVAQDTFATRFGGLEVHSALAPHMAEALVIGGLPKSRLPLLLGVFLLTAGLILATIHQIRRENDLGRVRADFVTSVSHELRTPLAQIRMFLETVLLGRVRNPDEGRRYLQIAEDEAKRLSRLVDNVLRFSRAERQAITVYPAPLELDPAVREIAGGFGSTAASRDATIRLDLRSEGRVLADRDALQIVLGNLLDNAVKYGPAGQTIVVGTDADASRARVWVEDRGPGVPPRDRERIWNAFERLDRDKQTAVAGSGIGLALVREYAWLHGGAARIEDAAGGGARFVVELPALQTPAAEPTRADGRMAPAPSTGPHITV